MNKQIRQASLPRIRDLLRVLACLAVAFCTAALIAGCGAVPKKKSNLKVERSEDALFEFYASSGIEDCLAPLERSHSVVIKFSLVVSVDGAVEFQNFSVKDFKPEKGLDLQTCFESAVEAWNGKIVWSEAERLGSTYIEVQVIGPYSPYKGERLVPSDFADKN